MESGPAINTMASRPTASLRGEPSGAFVGIAIVAVLLAAIGACAWWAMRTQAEAGERARIDQVRAVGGALAQGAEVMLGDNELSAVRRIIADAARKNDFAQCRIVLPDGEVIADANPNQIGLRDLPAKWSGAAGSAEAQGSDNGEVTGTFPLTIAGRGNATLEITAPVASPLASSWSMQAGAGSVSVGALVMLLVMQRWLASRLRGLNAIRQALLDHEHGQTSAPALEVNPDWGPEAQAWNHLLTQKEQQRKQIALEKTQETLLSRQRSSGELAAACDAMSQGLILVDADLRARYANGAAAVLLQAKREEILSGELARHLPDARVLEAVRAATTGPMHHRTIVEVERADGGGVLRFIVRPVRRGDRGVGMILIDDITQQRVADKARNAFVAQAAHELRTPLTNIRLYVETAVDEGTNDAAVRAKCLNVINQEVRRLERMVGDILSVAEIEAGSLKLKKDDVRLEDLFRQLQADYIPQAKEKQIEFTVNLPPKLPTIQGDRDKLSLGVHNLVGNALKYTPAGGKVSVDVTAESGRLVAEVSDTGIGIGPEDCQRIFEKFYRANDRRVAGITGSGLGLAIAREVIRLHGGDITVRSQLDKGSTFTLVLPIAAEGV